MMATKGRSARRFQRKHTWPLWPVLMGLGVGGAYAAIGLPFLGVPLEASIGIGFGLNVIYAIAHGLRTRLLGRTGIGSTWGRAGFVDVGTDGVAIRGSRAARFVPYGALADVRAQGMDRVRLTLENGEEVVIGCESSEELEEAILSAQSAYRATEPSNLALLERAEAKGAARDGSYREEPVTDAELLAIASDPKAPAAARRRAFEALSGAGPRVQRRLRVALEEIAEPVLRQQLEMMGGMR